QAPGAFAVVSLSEYVRMEAATQRVELFLQCGRVKVELARKSKKSEIVHWDRRLHFAACTAEVHRAHGSARPATCGCFVGRVSGHDQRRFEFRICHNKI